MRGLITAFRTLTLLPVPGEDAENMSSSLPWFPVVGAVLGILLWGLAALAGLISGGWAQGIAVVVLVAGSWLTRGIHLDGLADMADGFGGGHSREKALLIMKDSNVGAFGVIALILIFLAKFAALCAISAGGALFLLVPAFVISRYAMVNVAVSLPYARQEGTGGPFIKGASSLHSIIAGVISLVIVVIFAGWLGLLALVISLLAALLLSLYFKKRVGGVTGDLLGATSEITEALTLLIIAAYVSAASF